MLLNEAADMNLFLGDLCGYYHDQIEIFDRLRTFPNLFAVLGNHDQIFLDIKKGNAELAAEYLSKYGRSMELLLERENCQMADWLRALPKMLRIPKLGCLVCHGSPDDPLNGYIYPDTDIAFQKDFSADYIFMGHTHYLMNRRFASTRLINPGSLGQPRGGGDSTYATIDLKKKEIRFKAIEYDRNALIKRLDHVKDFTPYLRKVLNG